MNVTFTVLLTGLVMLFVEQWRPAWRRDWNMGWLLRAAGFNTLQALIAHVGVQTWDRLLEGGVVLVRLDDGAGAVATGYLLVTFVYYWWHRARHSVPGLWRWVHRVHHSPARIEVLTSFYKHPVELVLNGVLSSLLLYTALGLSPLAVTTVVLITGLAELFYHWNVRTPRWLGWFFQRPEMHRVHHERGLHTSNFSDLPLWDALFGTLYNPHEDVGLCGFVDERRWFDLILGKPVREK